MQFFVTGEDSGTVKLTVWRNYTGTDMNFVTSTTMTINEWHHVVATIDGTAMTAEVFIDGVKASMGTSTAGTTALADDSGADLYFGNNQATDRTFDGKICKVKMFDSVLTDEEIATLGEEQPFKRSTFTGHFSDAAMRLLEVGMKSEGNWKLRYGTNILGLWDTGTGTDSSDNGNDLSGTGSPATEQTDPFGGTNAIGFDGTDDYWDTGATSDLEVGKNFTFAAWIYNSANTDSYPTIMNFGAQGATYIWVYTSNNDERDLRVQIGPYNDGTYLNVVQSILPKDTWVHLGLVFDGNSGILYVYKNGHLYEKMTYDNSRALPSGSDTMYFGDYQGNQSDHSFKGRLYNILWSNKKLAEQDMKNHMYGDLYTWSRLLTPLTTSTDRYYEIEQDITYKNYSVWRSRVTHEGLAEVQDFVDGSTGSAPAYVEWNDSTVPVSVYDNSTEWDQEGSNEQRNAWGTNTTWAVNEARYRAELTRTQLDGVEVTKSGLFVSDSGGTMWAETRYGDISKNTRFFVIEDGTIRFI